MATPVGGDTSKGKTKRRRKGEKKGCEATSKHASKKLNGGEAGEGNSTSKAKAEKGEKKKENGRISVTASTIDREEEEERGKSR